MGACERRNGERARETRRREKRRRGVRIAYTHKYRPALISVVVVSVVVVLVVVDHGEKKGQEREK